MEKLKRMGRFLWKQRIVRYTVKDRLTRFAFLALLLFYLVAFFGPVLIPRDPLEIDISKSFLGFSWEHPFGTDGIGRDVFARVVYAMRTTALISVLVFFLGGWPVRVALGLIAGYYGGWRDKLILRLGEVLGAIPPLVFLMVFLLGFTKRYEDLMLEITEFLGIAWFVESGIANIVLIAIVLSLIGWIGGVYLLRSRVLQEREQGYVESLRVLGASEKRILFGHIPANVIGLIILNLSALLLNAIASEISLTYLGLGIKDPYPSFGIMVFQTAGLAFMRNHPHLLLIPAAFVLYIGIFSFILGDRWGRMVESRRSHIA